MGSDAQGTQDKEKDGCGYKGWRGHGGCCGSRGHCFLWVVVVLLLIGEAVLFTSLCHYRCMMRNMCATNTSQSAVEAPAQDAQAQTPASK